MGRSYKKIKNILENENDVKFNKLCAVLNTQDTEEMIYLIVDELEEELYNYKNEKNSSRMERGIEIIINLVKRTKNIDIDSVIEMLENLSDEIDDRIYSHPEKYNKKDLKSIMYTLEELSNTLYIFDDEENSKYKFLEYVIFEKKNFYYIKNVINYFPEMINCIDIYGNSLICNVILRYLDLINKQTLNTDTYYFDKVIDILLSDKSLKFSDDDKATCLSKLYNILANLKDKDQLYNLKKILLINLKEDLLESRKDKYRLKLLKEKYNIKEGFDRDILKQLEPDEDYQNSIPKQEIDDYIISIDGDYATEIDDALSATKLPNGNYLLGVHIASVTSYFDYNSLIVQNALEREENIYERDKIISIFPKEYSSNKGSLLQGTKRFAESHYFEIQPNGIIIDAGNRKSIITNSKKTTYKEVSQVIEEGSYDKEFENTVKNLVDITKIISKRYDYHTSLEEEPASALAHDIVNYCMILHNEFIAIDSYENNRPIAYLVQEESEEPDEILKELSQKIGEGNSAFHQQIFCYEEESKYAKEGKHKGLKLDHYVQCSSPLRRSVDILNQRSIDLFYYGYGTDEERKQFRRELKSRIKKLNKQKENIKNYIKKRRDF